MPGGLDHARLPYLMAVRGASLGGLPKLNNAVFGERLNDRGVGIHSASLGMNDDNDKTTCHKESCQERGQG
jgi:hypothetical protein